MPLDLQRMNHILDTAAAEGRFALLEHEVYAFLGAAGCRAPRLFIVEPGQPVDATKLQALGGDRVMLKIVSPEIAHKTEVGGVKKCAADPQSVAAGVAQMLEEVPPRYARQLEAKPGHAPQAYQGKSGKALEDAIRKDLRGVMVVERMALEGEGAGSETIVALRHNREFGPVLTMGVGGIDTELLGEACKKGLAVVSGSASLLDEKGLLEAFRTTLAYRRLAGQTRTGQKLVDDEELLRTLRAFRDVGEAFGHDGKEGGWTVTEIEVNPFGACQGSLVALDGILKFRKAASLPQARPLSSLTQMLKPQSMAIIGASAKGMNMGRIILRNMIESGFDKRRMYVLRPESTEIDGVKCYPTVKDLPERVDLLVVAVGAEQVPGLMEELVEHDKAVGVILIPGGMGEKEGGQVLEARLKAALRKGRELGRPLVANGGNCLGIVSRPGRYHTLFIPQSKLPLREDGRSNVALISQSGAFMISRMSKMGWLSPRYAVSTGNQVDLTISDFLRHLAQDPEVRTFAVYVEGFKDADGLEFSRAVREVVHSGRDVVFYKAGRTAEGKHATSGHTASLAGDYDVCESVVRQSGAYVARNFDEFADLLKVSSMLGSKKWKGRRIAALSNAGYEAVGIADALRGEGWHLELTRYAPATREALQKALAAGKLDALVDVRNPMDITPMAGDQAHEDVVRTFLADPGVDAVLCATIPLTPAMATLAQGVSEEESIRAPGSLVNRLARVLPETDKPIVVSIDSGALYDAMALALEDRGLPVFRSADVAIRTMGLYLEPKLRQ
ncbi:MAG: acetate--CoA ligase family protein [Deltaproteobacteria bacterium]|nr:acetate--CoA ligase family protein [Deltaproteobacteria bacterium]